MDQNQNPQNDRLAKIREARKAAQNQVNQAGAQLNEASKPTQSETKQNPLRKFLPQKPQQTQSTTQPDTFSNPVESPNAQPGFSPYVDNTANGSGTIKQPLDNGSPMPGTVGKTLDQFKPSLPASTLPSENPKYRILGDRDLSREQAMQLIGNARSMKELERLEISNDPEVMEGMKRKFNEFKNPTQAAQPQAQPVIDKPWWEDTWDGIKSGSRSALSALYEGSAELADIVGTGGPANPNFIGQYNMIKQLQAKGLRGAGFGAGLREMADTEKKRADVINAQADTESIGFFAGQMMPYVAGSAVAIAAAPVSAPLAAGLGAANVGALALASVGSGLQTYDQYKAEKGLESDPYARLGVGLLYGGAEFAMERLSLSKLLPKQFKGKVASAMFGAVPGEVMEEEAKQLVEEFAKTSTSRRAMVDGLLKDTGKGILVEGATEAATEVAQEFTNWLYYENEDRYKWEELAKNTATAFAGGALMGAGLGPLSYGSQRLVNNKRREQTGKVVIAQNTESGEAVEIMGISPGKKSKGKDGTTIEGEVLYDVVRPNGRVAQLSEDQVGEFVELPVDVFKGLLNGKVDGEAAIESRINQEQEQAAQDQAQQFRAKYEPYTFTNPIDGQQIAMGKKNGEPVYIKAPTSDGFVIVNEEGEESMVPKDALTDITQMPFEEFLSVNGPTPGENGIYDPARPIQMGEPVNFQGENWTVTGVDTETGTVQLESQDADGVFETVPTELFQSLRKPAEELIQESTTDPNETSAGKLRNLFQTGEQVELGGESTIEERNKLPKATPESQKQYQDIASLVEKKLGAKFDFAIVGLQKELRLNNMKDFLIKNGGEIGAELADIIDFPAASLRFLNNLPDAPAQTTQSEAISDESGVTDLTGQEQVIAQDAPAESADQGVDNQVQVREVDKKRLEDAKEIASNGKTFSEAVDNLLDKSIRARDKANERLKKEADQEKVKPLDIQDRVNSYEETKEADRYDYLIEQINEVYAGSSENFKNPTQEAIDFVQDQINKRNERIKKTNQPPTTPTNDQLQQAAQDQTQQSEAISDESGVTDLTGQEQAIAQDAPAQSADQGVDNQVQVGEIEKRRQTELKRLSFDELMNEFDRNNFGLIGLRSQLEDASFRVMAVYQDEQSIIVGYKKPDGKQGNFSVPISDQSFEKYKNKYENVEWSDSDINAKYDAELAALNQPTLTTNENRQTEQIEQSGQENVQTTQNEENSPEENEGQEGLEQSTLTPSQYEDVDSAQTEDDLVSLYDAEVQNLEGVNPIDAAIAQVIGKVDPESYNRFGDRNNISKQLAGNWLSKKGKGLKIDTIAQEASESFSGRTDSITPQDVIDFMDKFSSADNIAQPSGNPKLRAIQDKYVSLTGKQLNRKTAESKAKKLKGKSVLKNDQGQLLESDDQITEYLANNPDILDFLESQFGEDTGDIFEKGAVNYQNALDKLNSDPSWFTSFPGGFKPNEVEAIRTYLTSKINEQTEDNTGADSPVQADTATPSGDQSSTDQPATEIEVASTGAGTPSVGDGQKSDSPNADNTGETEPGGDTGTGSDLTDGSVVQDQPKKATSLSELVNTPKEKKTKPSTEPQATPVKEDLQDVGEKIGGSKKDGIKKYFDRINLNGRILSNIFPKPDIKSLLDSGLSVKDVGAIKVAYEFAVQDKKKGPEIMKFYAAYAKTVLAESINLEFKNDRYVFSEYGKSQIDLRTSAYEQVANQIGQEYLSLDLSKVRIVEMTQDMKKRIVSSKNEIKNFRVQYYVNTSKYFDTKEEALNQFVEEVKANTKTDIKGYKYKPGIFNVRSVGLVVGLSQRGKPFMTIKDGFKSLKEASEYLKSNRDDIEIAIERILSEQKAQTEGKPKVSMKLINETSRDRIGKDWRNGKDVSSKEFADSFGLRAVEFGVWVNLKERQAFVNASYDSLMDLAQLMSIDPKSISLNGQLAISFGSRGSGQASAHYEPGKKVINLTKTKGLGSLAHEWYHAIDNYFAGFETGLKRMSSATLGESKPGTRQELKAAFDQVYQSLQTGEYQKRSMRLDNKRNMDYYSTGHEMAARAFENYVLTRLNESGQVNDFLVNYVSNDNWKGEPNLYPYPIGEESVAIREAFDNLSSTIQVNKTDPNRPMFLKLDPQKPAKKPSSLSEMIDTAAMRATVKPTSKAASLEQVQSWTDEVVKSWNNKPTIQVFADPKEAVSQYSELQPYADQLSGVPGLIIRDPKSGKTEVLLFASHAYLNNKKGVEITLLHEVIGHYGIREGLRRKAKGDTAKYEQLYGDLMDTIFTEKKDDLMMADIARRYYGMTIAALDQTQQRIIADEFIAHLAQSGVKDSLLDRVIAKMREILRSVGFDLKFTDSEIRNLIGNSMRIVSSPQGPMVRPNVDQSNGPNFMIIGEQGAANMDRKQEVTYRIDNLAVAREMEAGKLKDKWIIEDITGVTDITMEFPNQKDALDYLNANKAIEKDGKRAKSDRFTTKKITPEAQIRQATGWERGADRKWRYEIKDPSEVLSDTFILDGNDFKEGVIENQLGYFMNKELNQAYQQIRGIKVRVDINSDYKTPSGSYSASTINDKSGPKFIEVKAPNIEQAQSVLLHEVQHAIQDVEGFARGSNLSTAKAFELAKVEKELKEINEKMIELGDKRSELKGEAWDKSVAEHKSLVIKRDALDDKKLALERDKAPAYRAYNRMAGEVEARNVQNRSTLSEEERKAKTLQSTEDVSREDQIFIESATGYFQSISLDLPQTESPAFKSWFGDSKVVDSDGNPLVVYHGTTADFDQFKPRKKAPDTLFEKDFENDVYFFSNSADTANAYAESSGMNGASIMPTYVSIKNPYTIDRKGKGYRPNMMSGWIKQAKDAGHDGMIISNMADMGGNQNGTQYVAFKPSQIKSATGNQGTFDPNNADIRFMKVGASPVEVNSALANEEKKNQTKLQQFFDKDRNIEKYQDNMIGSKRLIQRAEAKSGEKIRDDQDFYTQENLSKGKVLKQTEDFDRDYFKPIIQTARQIATKYKFDSNDIGDYLVALHHGERKDYFQKKEKSEFMQKAEADYNTRKDLQEKSTLTEYLAKQEVKIDKKIAEKDDTWPTGVNDEWAKAKLKEFTNKVPQSLLDQLDKQVQAANTFVNDKRLESGLISAEVHATLATQYEHYVPLRGFEETQKDDLTVYSPLLAAHGRSSKSGNPIPFLVSAAQEAIVKGENNKVRQTALRFVKERVSPKDYQIRNGYYIKTAETDADGNAVWVETIDKPTKEQLESGEATSSFNPDIQKSMKTNNGDDNVLSVLVNGRKVFIQFEDGSIAKAIKNTSQEQMGDTVKFMRRFSQHISRMYTQFSPEFGPRNLIRDLGFGTYNMLVDDGPAVAARTWKGIPKSSATLTNYFYTGNIPAGKDGEMLNEFMAEGSLTGYSDLKNVAKIYDKAAKEIEKINKTGIHKAAKIPKQGWDFMMHGLDTYNRTLENSVRFSYYKSLRENGVSKQESARKAKDLTVNFNRKGNSSSVMGSIFVFFNASVQGSERLLRSFANPKTRKKAMGYTGAIVAVGITQGILNTLLMGIDDDDKEIYAKIPDYIRRTNMIIPYGDGKYLAIPLPYGLNVFYSVGESIGRSLVSNVDPAKETLGLVSATMDSFSPFGGMEFDSDSQADQNLQDLLLMFTPTMIKPAMEIAFNRDFAGRNIYPEPFPGSYQKPNSERYFKGVNPIIKTGTDWVNSVTGGDKVTPGKVSINPEWIEHGINAYFGGPVSFAKNASTAVVNLIEGENVFSDPYSRNTPFYRSYFKKADTDYQSQQDFYQNYNKVKSAHQQLNQYKTELNTEKYRENLDENKNLINLYKSAESYRKNVKSINDRIDGLKSEDAKKNKPQIKKLEEKRTELFDAFNKRFNNATNPPKKKPESLIELFK